MRSSLLIWDGLTVELLLSLCITTVYQPVRELLQQERKKDMEKKKKETEGQSSEDASENKEDNQITLRSLNMEDMRQAKSQMGQDQGPKTQNAYYFFFKKKSRDVVSAVRPLTCFLLTPSLGAITASSSWS
ncbi:hypothetical protein HN873_017429, partial [Arachis hypogaea]